MKGREEKRRESMGGNGAEGDEGGRGEVREEK